MSAIALSFCACGQRSVKIMHNEQICQRCLDMQNWYQAWQSRRQTAGYRNDEQSNNRNDRNYSPFGIPFASAIEDRPTELVIFAHGEYHLHLAA